MSLADLRPFDNTIAKTTIRATTEKNMVCIMFDFWVMRYIDIINIDTSILFANIFHIFFKFFLTYDFKVMV